MVSRRRFLGQLPFIGSGLSLTACSTLDGVQTGAPLSLGDNLPNGALKPPIPLDTGFHTRINAQETARSRAIFQTLRQERQMPFSPGLPTDDEIEAAITPLRRISEKHPVPEELDSEQTFEVAASLIPILRLFARVQEMEDLTPKTTSPTSKRANDGRAGITNGVLSIPPGHMISLKQKGYCLDAGLPAPGQDEVLRFRPATELIPEPLIPLYRAMLQRAGKDSSYQNDMQALAWTLRAAGSENGMATHVPRHLLRRMNEALPGGAQTFIDYHNAERAKNKFKDTLGQMFNLQVNGKRINPLDFADDKKRDQIFSDLVRDMNRPVPGAHPTDGRNHQMLSPSLASYSVGANTLTPTIWLANAGVNRPLKKVWG